MRLDAITTDLVSKVPFSGSTAWANQAPRTLSVMLGKAVRDKKHNDHDRSLANLRTTMIYQHPDLEPLRDAINHRNQRVRRVTTRVRHNLRHTQK
jgi:hypothetical protein